MKITKRLSWLYLLTALSSLSCNTALHAAPTAGSLLKKLLVTTTLFFIHTAGKAEERGDSPQHALLDGTVLPTDFQPPVVAIQHRLPYVKESVGEIDLLQPEDVVSTQKKRTQPSIEGNRRLLQLANTTTATTSTTTKTTSTTEEPVCEKEEEDAYDEGYAFGVLFTVAFGLGPSFCCCFLCGFFCFYCRARCFGTWFGKYNASNQEEEDVAPEENTKKKDLDEAHIELYVNQQTGQSILMTLNERDEE